MIPAPPVAHDPGRVVTGLGGWLVIADRDLARVTPETIRNVDAETCCHKPLAIGLVVAGGRMDAIEHYDAVDVFIGVDVGKSEHHAVALDRSGKRLFDKALPNDEGRLRALIFGLKEHGQLLLVVDQPATIGALPITVA
jgi:hypothetical protein